MFKNLFLLILFTLVTPLLHAGSVAIAPVNYIDMDTGDPLLDASLKVHEEAISGAKKAGYTVVTGDNVLSAIKTETTNNRCESSCLLRVARMLSVDEVIVITIKDENQMNYETSIRFAKRDQIDDERVTGFFVYLEWFKGTIERSLLKKIKEEPLVDASTQTGPEPPKDTTSKDEKKNSKISNDKRKKPLSTTPFIISAAVTGVLGITWITTDIVVNSRYKKMVNNEETSPEYWNKTDNLQTFDKVALGLTITGLVTTGVLAIFTDFGKKNKTAKKINHKKTSKRKIDVLPTFTAKHNSGMININGGF